MNIHQRRCRTGQDFRILQSLDEDFNLKMKREHRLGSNECSTIFHLVFVINLDFLLNV
jgi:hypothetical protein